MRKAQKTRGVLKPASDIIRARHHKTQPAIPIKDIIIVISLQSGGISDALKRVTKAFPKAIIKSCYIDE